MTKYTKRMANAIIKVLESGQTGIDEMCESLGVSKTQYYVWIKKYPDFAERVKAAQEKRLDNFRIMALSGLAKLLNEHEYEEVVTEYENGKDGKPMVKAVKKSKKKIMPNPAAVIFTLTNRDRGNWSNRQNVEHEGIPAPVAPVINVFDSAPPLADSEDKIL